MVYVALGCVSSVRGNRDTGAKAPTPFTLTRRLSAALPRWCLTGVVVVVGGKLEIKIPTSRKGREKWGTRHLTFIAGYLT